MIKLRIRLIILFISITAVNSYAQLSGTYTIGGYKPDYNSIGEAIDDANQKVFFGPVTFKIRSGVYYENISLNKHYSLSSKNTLTLESESGDSTDVLIIGSLTISSPYVTVSSISISGSVGNGYCLVYVSNTSALGLKHCYIYAPPGTNYYLLVANANASDTIILDNNRFGGSNNSIYISKSNGTIVLKNNLLENKAYQSLEIYQSNGIEIVNNEFICTVSIKETTKARNIIRNNIFRKSFDIDETSFTNNLVYSYATFRGNNNLTGNKFFNFCDLTDCKLVCSNNEFTNLDLSGYTTGVFIDNKILKRLGGRLSKSISIIGNQIFGSIYINCNYLLFANNYVRPNNNLDHFLLYNSYKANIYNNNFSGYKHISFGDYPIVINNNFSSDDIYANNGLIRNNNYFPFGGKNDSHPTNYDPMYVNDTDLHATNPLLSGKGEFIKSIRYDIDSILRDSFSSIGANEICIDHFNANKGISVSCGDSIGLHLCNSPNSGNFIWTPDSGLDNIHKKSPLASPHKTTLYYVNESNSGYRDSILVVVKPFQVNTIPDTTLLCGDTLILYVTKNLNATYHWYPDTFLTTFKTGLLVAKPNKSINYFVTADIPGCPSSIDSLNLILNQYQVKTCDDSIIHCGGFIDLLTNYTHNSNEIKFKWYPSYGLLDSTRASVRATPEKTTSYIVRCDIPQCQTSFDTVTITVDSIPFIQMGYYQPSDLYDTVCFYNFNSCADSILWDFGDSSYSNIDNPCHFYKQSGQYHVSITAYNNNHKNQVDTTIWVNNYNSIHNNNLTFTFSVYPNPTKNLFYLKFNNNNIPKDFLVSIFDLIGKSVLNKQIKGSAQEIYSFDLSEQLQGIYIIKIEADNKKVFKKILKN